VLPYLKLTGIDPSQVVIDLTDAQSLGLRSRRDRMHFPARLLYDLELARIEHSERALARNFPHVVVTSEADRQELGSETVSIIRNGVDLTRFPYADTEREERRIVMTGNMGYQPNIDGALWFAERVWPRIRARYPNARWSVVGARPALALRSLDGQDGIEVLGQVEDLGAHLRHATIAIAPILCGAGIQNKVLEAFASGTPVVATSFANEGVQAKHGEHLMIADEPEAFAAAIAALFADPAMRLSLASRAHAFVEETLTWEAHVLQLEHIYASIAANRKVR
jgi:glycosyltransferase involved in cell wall biosynthesis